MIAVDTCRTLYYLCKVLLPQLRHYPLFAKLKQQDSLPTNQV